MISPGKKLSFWGGAFQAGSHLQSHGQPPLPTFAEGVGSETPLESESFPGLGEPGRDPYLQTMNAGCFFARFGVVFFLRQKTKFEVFFDRNNRSINHSRFRYPKSCFPDMWEQGRGWGWGEPAHNSQSPFWDGWGAPSDASLLPLRLGWFVFGSPKNFNHSPCTKNIPSPSLPMHGVLAPPNLILFFWVVMLVHLIGSSTRKRKIISFPPK